MFVADIYRVSSDNRVFTPWASKFSALFSEKPGRQGMRAGSFTCGLAVASTAHFACKAVPLHVQKDFRA